MITDGSFSRKLMISILFGSEKIDFSPFDDNRKDPDPALIDRNAASSKNPY
jgi:hypothetical protein